MGWLQVHRWQSESTTRSRDAAEALARPQELPRDHIFLVIAGLGFDAAMVADTDEQLKARVGWIAYFVAGHARTCTAAAPACTSGSTTSR